MHSGAKLRDELACRDAGKKSHKPAVIVDLSNAMPRDTNSCFNSGGGTRTPDTRIMIPRDVFDKWFATKDLGQADAGSFTPACTNVIVNEELAELLVAWSDLSNVARAAVVGVVRSYRVSARSKL